MERYRRDGESMRVVRALLFGAMLLVSSLHVSMSSADPDPAVGSRFRRLSIADGLPDTTVYAVVQDRYGFLWVGTEQGLCRYDGYSFSQYRSQPGSPRALRHPDIATMLLANDGGLWIGTWGGGLQRYDPATDSFTTVATVASGLPDDRIQSLYSDNGVLWIGTFAGGLVRLDVMSGGLQIIDHDPDDPGSLSHNRVWSICRGPAGQLWVATEEGINLLDADGTCVRVLRHSPDDATTLSQDNVRFLYTDTRGRLWVGTWQGLNRFDPATGGFHRFLREGGNSESPRDIVNVVSEDGRGNLWIGTGGGLYRLDPESLEVLEYDADPDDPDSLGHNDIRALLVDRSEVLWVGTRGGGLNALDLKSPKFHHVEHRVHDTRSFADPRVHSLAQDTAGRLWVATARGLDRQRRPGEPFAHFRHAPDDPTSIPSNDVRLVLADSAGRVWAATWRGGLVRFLDDEHGFLRFSHDPEDPFSLADDNVSALFEDGRGRLWVGMVGGVDLLDHESGRCSHFSLPSGPPNTMPGNFVWALAEDHSGSLWIATDSGGLYQLAPGSSVMTGYAHDPSDRSTLCSNRVLSLLVHSSGALWIGTDYGLNRLDEGSQSFTRLDEEDGLPNPHIAAMLEDDDGRLWVSTHRGLACIDPETDTIRTYSVNDGLQGNIFYNGSALRSHDGLLFFGGTNGFNWFRPAMVRDNPYMPPVVITAVRRFDEPLDLSGPPWVADEIHLGHRDLFIAFEFAALDFTSPDDNRYAYRLEGFDRDWIEAGSRRYVSYTNLNPGHYLFRVRGTNNDGCWNQDGDSVAVIIAPPFWRTWWFRTLVAACVLLIVFSGHRVRVRALRRHERELAQRVAKALARLQYSEQRYRQLFERNLAGVVQLSLDGSILDCNEAFASMVGAGNGEAVDLGISSRQIRDLLGGEEGFAKLLTAVRDGGQVAGYETSGKRADGTSLTLLWNATLVVAEGTGDETIESTVIDISEHRQMEDRVRQSQKLESLALMAGGIAHDFNNILMAIQGNAELAQLRLPTPSPVHRLLQGIEQATERAAELSNQMLAYSGHYRFTSSPVDLSELVRSILRQLRGAAPAHVEVVVDLQTGLPEVSGDAEQLGKVLRSLFTNAWEAIGDSQGQVVVRTTLEQCSRRDLADVEAGDNRPEPGPYVMLQVKDTGTGMDAHTRARLFDPFFTTKFTGRGLGLAAVLGMVRSHNGAIRVDSTPHQGTTVSVLLPVAARAEPETQAEPMQLQPAETANQQGRPLVLVVDDEPAVRETASGFLEAIGCSVLTAADGKQGIELFTRNADKLRLVLLDLSMPGLSGGEVLAALRSIRWEVPVILSSGYGEEAVDHLLGEGAAGFIHKPYGLDKLRTAVSPYL